MFPDIYRRYDEGQSFSVIEENRMIKKDDVPEGSDLKALFNNYTSVGKIRSHVL